MLVEFIKVTTSPLPSNTVIFSITRTLAPVAQWIARQTLNPTDLDRIPPLALFFPIFPHYNYKSQCILFNDEFPPFKTIIQAGCYPCDDESMTRCMFCVAVTRKLIRHDIYTNHPTLSPSLVYIHTIKLRFLCSSTLMDDPKSSTWYCQSCILDHQHPHNALSKGS